jgi:hypothetical protein
VSPPVNRSLLITEQASLAQLHAIPQAAFGWSDQHLYAIGIDGEKVKVNTMQEFARKLDQNAS